MKKMNLFKLNNFFLCEIFCENHPPTHHLNCQVIDFAPGNNSIMAVELRSTNLKPFLRRIKSPLTR